MDSFSHAWDNEGGVLDLKTELEQTQNKNSFTVWNEAGKIQNHLENTLLSAYCNIIVTMRSKMAYTSSSVRFCQSSICGRRRSVISDTISKLKK